MTKDDLSFWARMFAAAYLYIACVAGVIGLLLGLVAWLGGWGMLIWVLCLPPMIGGGVVVVDKIDRWV